MVNKEYMDNHNYESVPEFIEITDAELEVIRNVREKLTSVSITQVLGDISEIDEKFITVIYTVDGKDEVVKINRTTLKWEI